MYGAPVVSTQSLMRLPVYINIIAFCALFVLPQQGAQTAVSRPWQQQHDGVTQARANIETSQPRWQRALSDLANLPAVPPMPELDSDLQFVQPQQQLQQQRSGQLHSRRYVASAATVAPGAGKLLSAGITPTAPAATPDNWSRTTLADTVQDLTALPTIDAGQLVAQQRKLTAAAAAAASLKQQQQVQHNRTVAATVAPGKAAATAPTGKSPTPVPVTVKKLGANNLTVNKESARVQLSPMPQPSAGAAASRIAQLPPIDGNLPPQYDDGDDYALQTAGAPVNTTADVVPAASPAAAPSPAAVLVPALDEPLYISPPVSFSSITEVNVDQPLLQIPQSFLGISHEWTHVEEINNIPGYKDIIKLLASYGSGPFNIRVGGGSTDKQAYVFPQYVYDALRQVHEETGAEYILGLNFEKSDIELARAQMKIAQDSLPPEAIQTFEIGNEPNFYEGTKKNLTAMQYVRCCFVQDWSNFARNLSCPCGTWQCCEYGRFAGPVWGHVNVFPTTWKWFLDANHKFVKLSTIHWYKATKETYNTPISLLEEPPIRKEMDNLRTLVQTSQGFGIPLRVAEMNTISNSGRVGVSNVFAATLWTLDSAFEVAATGAVGVNFHQGSGQNLYTGILRWYTNGKLGPPVLRPPFYGMVMFQQAVRGGSQLLGKTQMSGDSSSFKVWPLLDVNDQELRFVILNKHHSKAGVQTIRLNRDWGYNSDASVTRLVARGEDPLSATSGITIGGYWFAVGGLPKGEDASELAPIDSSEGLPSWNIYMPPGSAALVRIAATPPAATDGQR